MKNNSDKKTSLYKSFCYAIAGVLSCIRRERNMKIHCIFIALVIIMGVILKISAAEWCVCLLLFGLVMALELVNTSIEAVVDLITEEKNPLAGRAKDMAAGAVLIAALMAAVIGCIIFLPKLIIFVEI